MKDKVAEEEKNGNPNFTHFNAEANELEILEEVFDEYGRKGTGRTRTYIHDEEEAQALRRAARHLHGMARLPADSDLLFYEGLHGCVVTDKVNLARHADLKIGVVPVINLEWIQKIHRDRATRGYSTEAVMDVILRRMPDYVRYICPQFAQTNINFQRVPIVDTSNPFIARWIPTPDESMLVIRFANPRGIDFPYLLSMIHDSFMSRANSIVMPGGKLDLAMQLILTPLILQLIERKRARLVRRDAMNQPCRRHDTPAPPRDRRRERDMANAIRALAMDAVQKANSGHPGMPMGMADVATVLFSRFLKFDPSRPDWPDRDRFVLSAGHGSMLLYALHHLTRLRGHADRGAAALPPARQPHRRPSRIRPRARHRDDDRPARPGPRHRRRHGARRAHAGGPLRRRPGRSPHLCDRRRRLPAWRASATRRSTLPAI